MLPLKVNVCGQATLEVGVTVAFAAVTLKGAATVAVAVGVLVGTGEVAVGDGVKVLDGGQFRVNVACGDEILFGLRTWILSQPVALNPGTPNVQLSGATFCVPEIR